MASELPSPLASFRENEHYIGALAQRFQSNIGVIPFIGAGLSKPLGFPLWSEFLKQQAAYAGLNNEINQLIANMEFEEAAQRLLDARGALRFEDAVEAVFGKTPPETDMSAYAVAVLPRLARGVVLTTNFDSVLERVFENAHRPFEKTAWGTASQTIIDGFDLAQRVLVKLHGDSRERTSRVLTLAQYRDAYGDDAPGHPDFSRPLANLLRIILFKGPLLFVGCSLAGDRTLAVMKHVAAQAPGIAHFAIVERPKFDSEIAARDRFLSDCGIKPIWYPYGQHSVVTSLLRYFADLMEGSDKVWQPAIKGLPSFKVLELLSKNRNGMVLKIAVDGKFGVLKKTRRELCQMDALQRLATSRLEIKTDRRGLTTSVATPFLVHDDGEYVVELQPFVHGITLEEIIHRSRPYTIRGNLLGAIFDSLLLVLDGVHRLGVLHRDVNPSNILVSATGDELTLTVIDCFICLVDGLLPAEACCEFVFHPSRANRRRCAYSFRSVQLGSDMLFHSEWRSARARA